MLVYIRGAGATASGIALRLYYAGCRIVMSDLEHPRALRRNICFSEALRLGKKTVEGIGAFAARDPEEAVKILRQGQIAVMNDPEGDLRGTLPFDACVDAVLSDEKTDTSIMDAPIVIGVGDGFVPGVNCHAFVYAYRKSVNGRACYAKEQLFSIPEMPEQSVFVPVPRDGLFYPVCEIGDPVKKGETVAVVDNEPVICPENGVIGGILAEGAPVTRDRRCAEILMPEEAVYGKVVSEKALAVGGGVLEALLHFREVY